MNIKNLKEKVGWEALNYIESSEIIGVGSGSTVSFFIQALATIKHKIDGVVSSSKDTTTKLNNLGIPVINCNDVDSIPIYVDSANEINNKLQMIKGGGAALTQEKVIAAVSKKFICIVDVSKKVDILGNYPIPLEVIPMARSYVAREIVKMGGYPQYRQGIITDNGNIILDIFNLNHIIDPSFLEKKLNMIAGIITVGIFAIRSADIALISTNNGITVLNS
ncbi:MAG: ribose-5-phosphate isomerase RpiA [Candidatus Dasytiphilus stammeri]